MVDWKAKWIWSGDPYEKNAYRIFRKEFVWDGDSKHFHNVHISADTNYRLYVNGHYKASGPAPSTRKSQTFDTVRVILKPRVVNVFTVIVHHAGVPLFSGYHNRGGLILQFGDVVTDETWQVATTDGWDRNSPRLSVQQGFAEYYDARREPAGIFLLGEINPAEWRSVDVICDANSGEWPSLIERDIPMQANNSTVFDVKGVIIEYGNCTAEDYANVGHRMQTEKLRPLNRGTITRDAGQNPTCEIHPDGADVYLLYDFGREVSGYLQFNAVDGNSGATIDIGYDEILRPTETSSGLQHVDETLTRLSYADQLTLKGSVSTFTSFNPRAFRYVRLAIRGLTEPLTLWQVRLEESTYPVNRLGTFSSSDGRLNQIWEIGRRTLQLCMDDRFMDCPWRERAQWIGDAKIEAIGAALCFGDKLLHRRFLRQIAEAQHDDGRIDPVGPGEWDDHAPNRPIHGFMCIWIASIWDYYLLTADGTVPTELLPNVLRALEWLGQFASGPGGLLEDVGGWNFTDWAPGLDEMREGIAAPVNAFYIAALRVASRIAAFAGNDEIAQVLEKQASHVAEAFAATFWNEQRGVFVDQVINGIQQTQASQHTNSLAILFELYDDRQRSSVSERLQTDTTLTPVMSPYFSYYLLAALYKLGRHDDALTFIRDKWGAMLDAGATSWWEVFSPDTSSHCHAWSIGPTIDLITEYLGVKCAEPGFAQVEIAPHPTTLTWAKGIVPIPEGDVVCSWRKTPDQFTLDVSVPVGIHIRPILPCSPTDHLVCDGEPVHADSIMRRTDTEAELCVMPGSGYRFEVLYNRPNTALGN